MSAHQMICHAADALRMAMGEKTTTPDTTLFKRTLLKWVALYAPVPWPRGIDTSPELDQLGGGGTHPDAFADDVAHLVVQMQRVVEPARRLEDQPHPYFGRMSRADWLRWGYLHLDHHLRQFGA